MSKVRSGGSGYTIVETMIFLAVSGALFASVMVLIGGQQQKTQFAAAVRDLDNKLQSVMGNVASGYYSNAVNPVCQLNGSHTAIVNLRNDPVGTTEPGTHGDCTFIGQALVPGAAGGQDFKIYSIVGLRQVNVSGVPQDVDKLADASPWLFIDTVETYTLNGADFESIKYKDSAGTYSSPTFSLGFLTGFVQHDISAPTTLKSGTANTNAYITESLEPRQPIPGSIGDLLEQYGDTNHGSFPRVQINPNSIQICITDGTRHGVITFKGSSTQTTIEGSCP